MRYRDRCPDSPIVPSNFLYMLFFSVAHKTIFPFSHFFFFYWNIVFRFSHFGWLYFPSFLLYIYFLEEAWQLREAFFDFFSRERGSNYACAGYHAKKTVLRMSRPLFVGNILVSRGHAPFGQRQESRPLAMSNTGSVRFTDFSSLCACSESSLTNLIGSGLNLLCLQSHSKAECRWTRQEVAILGADQKECGLWGRECVVSYLQGHVLEKRSMEW